MDVVLGVLVTFSTVGADQRLVWHDGGRLSSKTATMPPFDYAWMRSCQERGLKILPEKMPSQDRCCNQQVSVVKNRAAVEMEKTNDCVRCEQLKTLLTQKITTEEEKKQQLEASQTQTKVA